MKVALCLLCITSTALGFVPLWPSSQRLNSAAALPLCPSSQRLNSGSSLFATVAEKDEAVSILEKPKWSGGGLVSDIVNALIASPLFGLMKPLARNTLISTAEKNDIPWSARVKEYRSNQEEFTSLYNSVELADTVYPSYYTQEFHAYDDGNLNWQAAYECESATMAMALRVWPKEVGLTALAAQNRLRSSITDILKMYISETTPTTAVTKSASRLEEAFSSAFSNTIARVRATPASVATASTGINNILDVGCSVGVSTFYLADAFPEAAKVDGLDLSPHFLAVAKHRQQQLSNPSAAVQNINWIHANVENTGIAANTYDLATAFFVFHELPSEPSDSILSEMFRVTRPGGYVAIVDNNPLSPVIQNLPPALFTLMKSTEPWSDQYYVYNLEQALRNSGFELVKTVASDPRHRTVMARKPTSKTY